MTCTPVQRCLRVFIFIGEIVVSKGRLRTEGSNPSLTGFFSWTFSARTVKSPLE
jgi:hypothetical protein